jgi:hypothetical protein
MVTEGAGAKDRDRAFLLRCVIAAAADTQACWEEYEALVRAAAEDPPQEGGATRRAELQVELHRARAALLTAVEVRRLAVHEIEAERPDEGEDAGADGDKPFPLDAAGEGEVFPLDELRDDGPL